ncbi:hypothetical protein [Pseudoxanthomonas mexicana]
MRAKKMILLAAGLTGGLASPHLVVTVRAQTVDIGGQTCTQNWAWFDYYTNGQLTDSLYEPDGVTCVESGGGSSYGDPYYGGGTGGGSIISVTKAVNPSNNPNRATCRSAEVDREAHAQHDAKLTQSARIALGQGLLRSGALIKITYDDGGTEIWTISNPMFTSPLSGVPVPGSLKCP